MIPSGAYTGTVHGPLGKLLGKVWQGKVFTGSTVVNLIRGRQMIQGDVRETSVGVVVITYPQLGLTDYLSPTSYDGSTWDGEMYLLGRFVEFSLTRKESK